MNRFLLYKLVPLLCLFGLLPDHALSQCVLSGQIRDAQTKQTLWGVGIQSTDGSGMISDAEGKFSWKLVQDTVTTFKFTFLGYETQEIRIQRPCSEGKPLDIQLRPKNQELNPIVVTAGRMEQVLSRAQISTGVLQIKDLTANNSVTPDDALNRSPGMHVIRGQISIRGSSGYTLGVGSRVMMLLDGLPMLTAESSEILWNFLPIENTAQLEVIKGPGSALYGSGALGGVINLRSVLPGDRPVTEITAFGGRFDRPPGYHSDPWAGGPTPGKMGISVSHRQRFGRTGVVASLNAVSDDGYRVGEPSRRIRGTLHVRQTLGKGWSAGLHLSQLADSTRLYTFWESDTNAFMPYPGSTNPQLNHRTMVDPYVEYEGKQLSFSLKNRFYRSYTNYNNEDFGLGLMYYTEAQARYRPSGGLGRHLVWTGGVVQQTGQIRSDRLYGNQQTVNRSLYTQADWHQGRLEASLGARGEWFLVNGSQKLFQPVVRGGLNFAYSAMGNLRASAGQGFRSPSVAEMYSNTFVGTVRLASDPNLGAELSRSIELGIHQRVHAGKLQAYVDLAWFQSRYDSMIEYSFGVYIPQVWDSQDSIWLSEGNLGAIAQKYARFQPANIVEARITGLEAVVGAVGRWGPWGIRMQAGYTYTMPLNLKPSTDPRADTSGLSVLVDLRKYLKYRYLHLLRTDLAVEWKSWSLGVNTRYNSVILNIDEDFYRFMPGLIDYRIRSIKGDLLTDLRFGKQVYGDWRINLVIRNLGNRSWMPLPGNIGEQRNVILQLTGRI